MPHRVLFIHEKAFSLGEECGAGLDLIAETASWGPSLHDCLRLRVFDLLVPVAFAGSAAVVDFFEWPPWAE